MCLCALKKWMDKDEHIVWCCMHILCLAHISSRVMRATLHRLPTFQV